ncbi:MAG: hypothetical protein JNL21_01880 [Myxococcales bacterium]|nr:hypothetical protein [Myxococcales bacterium]
MKISSTCALVVTLCLAACGGDPASSASSASAKPAGSAKPADTAKPAESAKPTESAKPADAPADVIPEMAEFMKMLDGSDDGASKAVKKFGKAGIDSKELSDYTLREPKILKTEKKSDKVTCYDFEAKAGMMVDTFEGVCWEGGKIVSVAKHDRK